MTAPRTLQISLVIALSAAFAAPVMAKVTLPDGTVIPKPPISCYSGKPGGLRPIFACVCKTAGVCNIGKHCNTGSGTDCAKPTNGPCESTIWYKINENTCVPSNIDASGIVPQRDAAVKPERFRPACGLTFTLLTRGGAMFQNGFGWYNVVPGKKPALSDLHPLINATTQTGKRTNFTLLSNSKYKGGDIGFYLVTPEDRKNRGRCAVNATTGKTDCDASVDRVKKGEGYLYFSEPKHNPDNKGANSYIHLLLYNSKVFSHTFYFAWEDTYDGTSTDYSDFVTMVSGLSCAGAGVACTVSGAKGLCQMGVTKCDKDGNLTCEGVFKGQAEQCDGLDNDCDGKVDVGATCPPGKVCYKGACMPLCNKSSEFACQIGYECDYKLGYCIDKKCKDVTCKAGQICRQGNCENGCGGVVCPKEQICLSGICVDPCSNRKCNTGEVCKLGICLPDCTKCGGITCTNGNLCDSTTGKCYNPKCNPRCKAGTYCNNGTCVDYCYGVKCPGGVKCENGTCPPPGIGKKGPATDSQAPWKLDAGAPTSDTGVATSDGGGSGKAFYVDEGCNVAGGEQHALPTLFSLLMVGLLAVARRKEE